MARRPLTPEGVAEQLAVRPAASPLDVFIRPAQSGQLGQLASALSELAPELRTLGNVTRQREADKSQREGDAWASDLALSRERWNEEVKAGRIAPHQSPHFQYAAKRKLGTVAAERFNAALQERVGKLGDGASLDDFESAASESRKTYLEAETGKSADDLHFMEGFNATADNIITNARRQFVAGLGRRLEKDAGFAFQQSLYRQTREAMEQGASADAIAALWNAESDAWLGVNPAAERPTTLGVATLSELKAQALMQIAQNTGDLKLFHELAAKVKDADGTLADSPFLVAQLTEAGDDITQRLRQREAWAREDEHRRQSEAMQAEADTLLGAYRDGRDFDISGAEERLRETGVKNAADVVQKMVAELPDRDPRHYVAFRDRVSRGRYPSRDELLRSVTAGRLSRVQYDALLDDIEAFERAERELRGKMPTVTDVWNHPAMRVLESTIRSNAETKGERGILGNIVRYEGFTEADVNDAIMRGKLNLAQWIVANYEKYGDGAEAAARASELAMLQLQAGGIILPHEAGAFNAKTMPADPTRAAQTQRNRERQEQQSRPTLGSVPPTNVQRAPTYTRTELSALMAKQAQASTLPPDERVKLFSQRDWAIIAELGATDVSDLSSKLAEAIARVPE